MGKKEKNIGTMLKPLDSHKPADSVTFIPHERPDILRRLKEIKFDTADRLSANYMDLDWFGFEAISVYERNGKIVGFSSVAHREEYFDKDEARILNRYYESPDMRRTSKIIGDDHVCEMVAQQIDIAKKLGYKKVFISRSRSPRHLEMFIENVGIKTKTTWHMEDKKIAVCNPKNPECWQFKVWTEI